MKKLKSVGKKIKNTCTVIIKSAKKPFIIPRVIESVCTHPPEEVIIIKVTRVCSKCGEIL